MVDPLPIQPFTCPAHGRASVPGSKSITNRALALAALCGGPVTLEGALFSRDTRIMVEALRALGVEVVDDPKAATISVSGSGSRFPNARASIHVGNAGTAARFLSALLCLREGGVYELDGDPAMRQRPMRGLTNALEAQGARFEFHGQPGAFPFTLHANGLAGGKVAVDASASSQLLSALLIALAGSGRAAEVALDGGTVSHPFIEMTLRMIGQFGVAVSSGGEGRYILPGGAHPALPATVYTVEPDATAASYFLALPGIVGGELHVERLWLDGLQGDAAFAGVLEEMGLRVRSTRDGLSSSAMERPRGVSRDFSAISDTFLTLAALAPLLDGPTQISGIAHTRRQETDRVHAMVTELRKLGQEVEEDEGSLTINPSMPGLIRIAREARAGGGLIEIDTYEDHRVAMSFGILGSYDLLRDGRPWLAIRDPACCGKTFPGFFNELERLRQASLEAERAGYPVGPVDAGAGAPAIIAIDGGAATGKSSTARGVAARLGFMHVDTGSHYRALTLLCLRHGVPHDAPDALRALINAAPLGTEVAGSSARITIDGRVPEDADLRGAEVNAHVSHYAAQPIVREALKQYQRDQVEVARRHGFQGLVMEGRDIGSVIFPDATLKIFLEADEATRARRRSDQGQADSVAERDRIDTTRKQAPLVVAPGAIRLDNSKLSLDQVIARVVELLRAKP